VGSKTSLNSMEKRNLFHLPWIHSLAIQ
jgi:hypothetical protein